MQAYIDYPLKVLMVVRKDNQKTVEFAAVCPYARSIECTPACPLLSEEYDDKGVQTGFLMCNGSYVELYKSNSMVVKKER